MKKRGAGSLVFGLSLFSFGYTTSPGMLLIASLVPTNLGPMTFGCSITFVIAEFLNDCNRMLPSLTDRIRRIRTGRRYASARFPAVSCSGGAKRLAWELWTSFTSIFFSCALVRLIAILHGDCESVMQLQAVIKAKADLSKILETNILFTKLFLTPHLPDIKMLARSGTVLYFSLLLLLLSSHVTAATEKESKWIVPRANITGPGPNDYECESARAADYYGIGVRLVSLCARCERVTFDGSPALDPSQSVIFLQPQSN